MSSDRPIQRLRQATTDAIDAHRQSRRRDDTVRPGDLFVLQETRDHPVEWAVIVWDAVHERAQVVPGDTQPLCGGGDVTVSDEEGGPLTLRCRFATWVDGNTARRAHHAGRLTPDVVTRARVLIEATEAPPTNPAEHDPIYQDWMTDVVRPAVAILKDAAR